MPLAPRPADLPPGGHSGAPSRPGARVRAALRRPVRTWVWDGVVAAAVLAALVADLPDDANPALAAAFLLAAGCLAALRRVAPRSVAGAVVVLWYLGGFVFPDTGLEVLLLVALYSVGAAGARVFAVVSAGVVIALVSLRLLDAPVDDEMLVFGLICAVVVAATGVGLYRGTRRDLVRQWRDRAQALEREQERERELAATTERLRIARDMHDVVGHHLTVMVTLAEAAITVLPDADAPDGAGPAVAMIATTGREALAETRRMLGVLRTSGADDTLPAADPVEELAAPLRAAGLTVSGAGAAPWVGLPPDLAAVLTRIVQEALTNALKYAGPGAVVTVDLDRRDTAVDLTVTDDGGPHDRPRRPVVSSSGHGVGGMRERLAPWNGSVSAGAVLPRGWQVSVRLRGLPSI